MVFGEKRGLRRKEGKSPVEYGSLMLWDYFMADGSEAFARISGLMSSVKSQRVHMSNMALRISHSNLHRNGFKPHWKSVSKPNNIMELRINSSNPPQHESPSLLNMTLRNADVFHSRDCFTQILIMRKLIIMKAVLRRNKFMLIKNFYLKSLKINLYRIDIKCCRFACVLHLKYESWVFHIFMKSAKVSGVFQNKLCIKMTHLVTICFNKTPVYLLIHSVI